MNNGKRMTLLALGLGSWLALACSSSTVPLPDPCTSDADCPDGLVCQQGWCRTACVTSADCPDGFQCISGACLISCTGDNDCPAGQTCQKGFCAPTPPADGGDGDGDGGPPPQCVDNDGDGHGENCQLGADCDDNDPTSYQGALERCADGKDNDCDGQTDEADCGCQPGTSSACYEGPPASNGVGRCRPGIAVCQPDKTFGPCLGQMLPADSEECNGIDDDCDGDTDEGLLNACGTCGDVPPEQCGDGLDNNCDGQVDEGCECDPDCQCDQGGAGQQCVCHPPTHQPCYSGSPGTLGFGICRGGYHDCVEQPGGGWAWSSCDGEVLPGTECAGGQANGQDDDCDGATDEDCLPDEDHDGYSPPADCNDADPAIHPDATETCNGTDDDCNGLIDEGVTNACGGCGAVPDEVCADGLDNDCDGQVDENCGGCSSDSKPCYRGPDGTQGVGNCAWGQMYCVDGEFWSECQGDVLPEPEICDGADNDCDGETDEAGAIGSNACGFCDSTELCDHLDNDCDGLTDEGLRNYCGACIGCSDAEPCELPDTACDPASQVCVETACDGEDNDCDGLTDEGLLNACGTCGDSCYEQGWEGEDDWTFGDADGVSNSADPDELRLDSTTQSPHYIWIAGTNVDCDPAAGCDSDPPCYHPYDTNDEYGVCHTVRKFDTHTNQLIGVYSSWGWSPSRTAVAVDNTVWVGNRGCRNILSSCDAGDPRHGNAVHLDADGNLICRADVTGSSVAVRAVTIDADGNAWIGSWSGGHIYKFSGSQVQDNPDGTPRCVQLCDVDLQGSHAYGAAIDGNGFLWISTLGSGPLRKINTATCQIVDSVDPGLSTYGIAIDQNNNVWLGNWSGGATAAIRVDGQTGVVSTFGRTVGDTSGGRTRGVAVDQENNIWFAEWEHNSVSKFSPDGTHLGQFALGAGASGPLGMAVDFDDNIWAIAYTSGHASKYDLNGNLLATFSVGGNPYTYSDMTGYQLRTVTLKHGTWTVDYDSGYDGARWDRLEWSGSLATDDKIRVRARSAASEGALAGAGWSPYHDADPAQPSPWTADISAEVPPGRWIQVEITLETQDEVSPAFTGLRVFWQR